MRTLTTIAIGAALALTLTACGDDYDADLVDALKDQGASQEEAECFIDEIGEDGAQDFLDSIDADSPPDNADEIVEALDECGVAPDDTSPEERPEDSSVEEPEASAPESAEADSGGADIESVADCLDGEGLDVAVDEGPPARIDILGAEGSGAVFAYADETAASDATSEFIDTFGGGDAEFASGAVGALAYYYLNSGDEATTVGECLA